MHCWHWTLLGLDKGRNAAGVCDFLEIGLTTLREWLPAYKEQGMYIVYIASKLAVTACDSRLALARGRGM